MPQIQDPELTERLRRKFAIVGNAGIDTIAPELVGVVVVADLLPEIERFEGRFGVTVTGDANDIAEIALQNLDNVNSLVLDEFTISAGVSGTARFRQLTVQGTLVAGGSIHRTDLRGGLVVPAITPTAKDLNSLAGGGTILWRSRIVLNTPVTIRPNMVLAPAGTLLGTVLRDTVHWDLGTAAASLEVSGSFHFIPPQLIARGI